MIVRPFFKIDFASGLPSQYTDDLLSSLKDLDYDCADLIDDCEELTITVVYMSQSKFDSLEDWSV